MYGPRHPQAVVSCGRAPLYSFAGGRADSREKIINGIFSRSGIPYGRSSRARGKFQKESFAVPQADGTLTPRYEKTYGLENGMVTLLNHVKIKTTERNVVYGIHLIELLCVLLAFVI